MREEVLVLATALALASLLCFGTALYLALRGSGWDQRPLRGVIACAWGGHAEVGKRSSGGFACARCGKRGWTLDEFGLLDEGEGYLARRGEGR